ncbi:hypothetical protein [Nocardioides bizhenqiangii]|uniref:DUF5642 domain-containing protein n=1 Tax=Nocardioides bizhenqiangii TaxID=3095076 RepID=A0ABZ0ZJL3_9ACTN|nr:MULTISPECIES: hypothetical protein [unclassified Nocardioides]MDZ5620293.1 hypothetical protein [Nocardioides sp. HM23]WQQ24669.1 hypothetical protein SHK19_11875 [Nocardioides sp. HM61]
MRTSRTAAVATVLALSLLTACGDGGDDSDSSDDPVTETVTEAPSETTSAPTDASTTAETDVTPMDPTGDITQEQVDAALLTPEEVGPGFVAGTYSDENSPPLCDPSSPPVEEVVPSQISSGTQIDHVDGNAAMQEEIVIYATEAEATEAFTVASDGLACSEGTLDGETITISAPEDVTSQVNQSGLGTSTAWGVSSESFDGVLVASLAGRVIVATQFASAPGTDTSALPNPVEVAATAWAKALSN